jgi:hypothetical protein
MPHPIVFFLGGGCCGAGVVCCGFVVGFVYRSLLCRDDSVGVGMSVWGKVLFVVVCCGLLWGLFIDPSFVGMTAWGKG